MDYDQNKVLVLQTVESEHETELSNVSLVGAFAKTVVFPPLFK